MSLYNNWVEINMLNPNKSYYQYRKVDYTLIRGVYNKATNKGIEQIFSLKDEYEIDKTDELLDDIFKYQE